MEAWPYWTRRTRESSFFGRGGVGVGGVGGEDGDLLVAPGDLLPGVEEADGGAELRGLVEEVGEGVGVGGERDPELAGAEVAEDGGHAAHVVGVGVREDEGVEAADAARPEIGGDDLFADVEEAGGGGGFEDGAGGAAGVDQHGSAFGADEEKGVALADVDRGELELTWRAESGLGPKDGECGERKDDGGGDGPAGGAASGPEAEGPGENDGGDDERGGWGDTGVGEGDAADVADGEGDGVKKGRGDGGGEEGEPWADECGEEGEDGGGHEDAEQGDAGHVGGEGEEGGAMEVDGHGKGHDELGDDPDEDELSGAGGEADCGEKAAGGERAGEGGEAFGPEAERDAELGEVGREGLVEAKLVEIAGAVGPGQEIAFAERDGDAGDGDDGEHGHLKTGFEEGVRRPEQGEERGGAEGVEDRALAGEQAREQEEGGHGEGALHGGAEAGEQGEDSDDGDGDEGGGCVGKAEFAESPPEQAGDEGDVHAGDDEEVEGAGALEAQTQLVIEAGTIAEEHGGEHAGIVC